MLRSPSPLLNSGSPLPSQRCCPPMWSALQPIKTFGFPAIMNGSPANNKKNGYPAKGGMCYPAIIQKSFFAANIKMKFANEQKNAGCELHAKFKIERTDEQSRKITSASAQINHKLQKYQHLRMSKKNLATQMYKNHSPKTYL